MACRYREELVGKRFISVRSPVKLKIQKISEWEWRSGVVRALSTRDTSSLDLSVLIEFDDIEWTRREWVRIHDIFQLFLVEHTLVWAERPDPDKPKQSISWPGLSFRAVVDKVGLSGCKRKPVEFLVDRFLGLVEEKEIQIFQENDENRHPTALLRKKVQACLKEWLDYQDGQKILLTTPSVLVGYRLEVYRAEGTTQWYTAVIGSYNPTSKTLSVTDDTVLEEHNEDPTLIQMHLIDEGVVDSILRGVDIGGIAPRRRPRAVKQEKELQNSTSKGGVPVTSQSTTVSRNSVTRKARTALQQLSTTTTTTTPSVAASPTTVNSLVPSPCQDLADKHEVKGADKSSNKQRPQSNSRDRKRKVESDTEVDETKLVSSNKRRSKNDDSNSRHSSLSKSESSSSLVSSVESSVTLRSSPRNTPSKEKEKVRSQRIREIDKDSDQGNETLHSELVKTNGPVKPERDSCVNKVKLKLRSKEDKVDSPTRQLESPKPCDSPASRLRNESPRSRGQARLTTQNPEADAVIKNNVNSGNKKDKKTSSVKKERNNSASAKNEVSKVNAKSGKTTLNKSDVVESVTGNKSSTKNTGKESSQGSNAIADSAFPSELTNDKGNAKKDVGKVDTVSTVNKAKVTKPSENHNTDQKHIELTQCKEKSSRSKNSKKDKSNTTQGEDIKKCAKNGAEFIESNLTGKEKDTLNESGDNMHYIKKKQTLFSGGGPPGHPGIPTSNIDFNQSVTDQIARAEKLSSLGTEERTGSSSRLPTSESSHLERHDREFEREHYPRENKHFVNSVTTSSSFPNSHTNSIWSYEERSHSRNSEERCSSGFSDELRRPSSRVDELRSTKSSPASSPLVVDKAEPVQIYRDPELMSKNPVRSNVPNMHNSHKSYPNVHNPIPTQATRPSSVGMTSTPLTMSSGMERTSRTPVIPSMAYPSPHPGMGPSISSLSGLLPHGLHQLDPATLAIHQQIVAVQQQQVAAALVSQYGPLSMSYPPRGPLNGSQLEHLWQQKYPSIPVPPPWLLQKHQDDLVRDIRVRHEQEMERDRMEQLERERDSRERKERERRERERQDKERMDRERREREKMEQERAERERIERVKIEKEKQDQERRERERLERERMERSRILKESVGIDSAAAVDQHFTESLRIASQRNWKRVPNQPNHLQQHHHQHHQHHHHQEGGHYHMANNQQHHLAKYTAAQTGMWPSPSITLGTGKPKMESQSVPNSYKPNEKTGEIKPEEKIKQEQLRESDYRYAEMMRKHQELMSQQDEYVKQQIFQKRFGQPPDQSIKLEPKADPKDMKPTGFQSFQPKREPNVSLNHGKPVGVGSQFSLYGYKPEKYSYISTDQLQSYELDKTKNEKNMMMDSKYGIRPLSPGKKDMMSIPPPLIKDAKHGSVIVENKNKEGRKSSSPHANQQYTSPMSPHHQPKPAHTPERMHERPSPNSSSPGSSLSHGMSPSLAHSHHIAALKAEASRQATSRSQSPLRIASPQQLSAAVMQPMDYRCSPGTNKSRGSPGSSGSPHSSVASSMASSGLFTPAIAQPPVSLPHSSVSFSYSLIQQGLVPNPIYTNNSNGKNSDAQRTVSVTGTAQVPRAALSPQHGYGGNHSPQGAMSQGTKRKTSKEGNNRKRPRGVENQGLSSPGSNNPLNLTVPVTTPQILTNQSPYTTSNMTMSSPSTTQAAVSTATSTIKAASQSQSVIHNRLNSLTGFMDSFKSFVENTVQNAFLSDTEKEAQKRLASEQHQIQSHQNLQHSSQPYKTKSSLERSCTPVLSQTTNSNSNSNNNNNNNNNNSNNNRTEESSSLGNSGSSLTCTEPVPRVANGQIDTDSDTLSAPSPPPHLKQENHTASPHKSAKHPNLKKAWLQRHSDQDKQEVKAIVAPVIAQQPFPVPLDTGVLNISDSEKEKDKEQVKNCYVNCSYISPKKEGGSRSPISAIQNVIPNGTVEKLGNVDESTSSASEADTQGSDSGNPKRRKTKKDQNSNTKKQKGDFDDASSNPVTVPSSTQPTTQITPQVTQQVTQPTTQQTPPPVTQQISQPTTQQGKKKNSRKSKESKSKNNTDLSEETIKRIVENCKESSSTKEAKDTEVSEVKEQKKMDETYNKMHEEEPISLNPKQNLPEPEPIKSEPVEEPMETETSDIVKKDKKDKKKNKEKRDKKRNKESEREKMKQLEEMEDEDMDEFVMPPEPGPGHTLPPPIMKETELKAQQSMFTKPLVKVPVSVLRKTCEPFLQDGSCSEVTPKLMKCRECKMTPTQRGKTVPNIFCRFYAFRRLKYSQRGFVTIDGFSELDDADQEDIDPWIPRSPIIEPKIDVETAKFIVRRVGDKFCELVQQERDAEMCAGEEAKIAWKRAVTGVREMCDVCDTTLFNMHWVCHKCGFVVCLDCYNVKAKEITDDDTEKEEDTDEDEEEPEDKKDSDLRQWLTCSANRQAHRVDKLMLTQIIPKDALWQVGRLVHDMRDKWSIPATCPCSPRIHKKNGIKTGILDEAIKHLSPKKKLVNGIGNEDHKSKNNRNGNVKSAVYHPESASALSLLADVASMDSEKARDGGSPYPNKKKEGKNGKSYNPITEPVSPGSSEKKKPANCSTLRELLTKTAGKNAGKTKNNGEPSKKKSKTTNNALNDIIQNVVDKQIPKEVDGSNSPTTAGDAEQEPMKLLHYTPRLGASHALVRETPILIHNLTETSVLYPDVPHSWLCNGRLLRLHDPRHKGNLKIFMEQWKRGQPVLVSGVDRHMNIGMWKPEFFSKQFGELENDLINCRTGCLVVGQPMKHFWDGFTVLEERLVDEESTPMLLKLKDWPPSDDFSDVLPTQFNDLMQALPLPEYTKRDGRLNLVSRLPDFLVKPDLGPKMYIAYGSAQYPKEGTTNLHLDVSDACNVMVYVGYLEDDRRGRVEKDEVALKAIDMAGCDSITKRRVQEVREVAGALWHIFDACDADRIRDFLNKVANERGETIDIHHDPIHDQSWYLDEGLRDRLAKEYGVYGYTIIQCLGDSIFIPAGAPHQVRNLNNCIKVAEDFVSPENIHHCFRLTQEFRDLSDGHSNHEDKLQVKNIIYHAVKDSVTVLEHADPEEED